MNTNNDFVIDVSFECKKCSEIINQTVSLPEPNFESFEEGGEDWDQDCIYCDYCEHEHLVYMTCNFEHQYFSVTLDNEEISDGVPYYDDGYTNELDWLVTNKDQFGIFNKQLEIAEELNLESQKLKNISDSINIMNYAHIVAAIEGYLGSTFIHYVISNEVLLKNFILKNKDYKEVKFEARLIAQDPDFLKNHVSKYLDNLIFHKVEKIKPLFNEVIGHDFGEVEWLCKAVQKRHDCVHRAGITKAGEKLEILSSDIAQLISNSRKLSLELETTLSTLDEELNG